MKKTFSLRWLGLLAALGTVAILTHPFSGDRSNQVARGQTGVATPAGPQSPPGARSGAVVPEGNSAQEPGASVGGSPVANDSMPQFKDWLATYTQQTEPVARIQLEAEGQLLAQRRLEEMTRLIEQDPERALQEAIPFAQRQQLPEAIRQHLEQPISGRGDLRVLGILPEADAADQTPGIVRTAQLNGQTYRAFVYGRRLSQTTLQNIPLQGIAIGDALAVHESPIRVLDSVEATARAGEIAPENAKCPVSGNPISVEDAAAVVDVGGEVRILCNGGHIEVLKGNLMAAEGGSLSGAGEVAAALDNWSQGPKTLLYIRVRFSDQTADPQTLSDSQTMFSNVNSFFVEGSYDTTSITPTFTPVYILTNDTAYYVANDIYVLRTDALNAAKAGGFDYVNWNLDAVRYNGGPGAFSGAAYVHARGCWLKSSSAGVASHEFGHNYGLYHANSWNPTDETPIGPGTWQEYGDSFDTMGSAGAGIYHYNPRYKSVLNWITPDGILTASNSGVYRVYAHDFITSSNQIRGLRVPRDGTKNYWIDFRQKWTGNTWLMNGAGLRRADNANNNNPGSELLDTTPNSPDGKNDSALLIGRTFSDAGVHITPIGKGGTSPESLDVVVNVGTFPGNAVPLLAISASATSVPVGTPVNFTATASDPNGDSLAYSWDFDDKTYGFNTPSPTKSWSTSGERVVRCVVSDMKGGTASRWIVITVGSPSTFRISGRLTDGNGAPVGNVRVYNGQTGSLYRGCFTDSDGNYTIVNLASGSYTVGAAVYGFACVASGFTNPVAVGPSKSGINFIASPKTYNITGRITDGGVAVANVQVSDGFRTAMSNTNGDYAITTVPNGSYTLTATKSGYTFSPSGWANPVSVSDANVTNRNFVTPTYTISGEITGIAVTNIVTVTDGYRTTTSSKQGSGQNTKNVFTLSGVPAGSWNLRALLNGSSFSPSGFSNPLAVSGNTSGKNFALDAVPTYNASGTITYNGSGLADVTVTAGSRSSIADSRGGYHINGLTNGTYNVVPSLAGYGFTPSGATITIANANVSGPGFTAVQTVAPTVALSVSDSDASEPGANTGSFTVTRNGSTLSALTVLYSISGTATAGSDYSVLSGSVTIPAGSNSVAITVAPLDDSSAECSETVTATLTTNANYVLGFPVSGTVTLTDDDLPAVSIVALDPVIWENSAASATFRVSRSGCLSNALAVNYTAGGNASAGADYQALSGSITISAGASSANITVTPLDDLVTDGDKTLTLTLSSSASYGIGAPGSANLALLDNETNHAPQANAGPDQTVSILGLANLNGSATDDGLPGSGLSYAWTKISGPGTVLAADPSARDTTACFSMTGSYVLRLTVNDGQLSASDDVTINVTAADPARVLNAVNAGGPQYTDAGAVVYRTDMWFAGGNSNSSTASIAATADGALYQTERAGDFAYSIPVSGGNQTYLVALKFAETTANAAGQRLFDVLVDGNLVLENFDLYNEAGANTAFDLVMPVSSSNATLNIQFRKQPGSILPAKVNAILVGASQALAPAAPANFTATAVSGTQVQLSWTDNSANETNFQLEVSTDGTTYAPLANLGANLTSYTHNGLTPATTYYYRLRACNSAGCSTEILASAGTLAGPPSAPSNLTATAVSATQINLAWTDKSANENGFIVERSLNGTSFSVIATLGANATSYPATGLQKNTRYYFRVRAFNDLGSSAYSNTANTRTKSR